MKISTYVIPPCRHLKNLYVYIWGIPGRFDQAMTLTTFFFFFIQVCYRWPQKNDLQQFSDFFKNFSGSNGRNGREIRAVIDFFETYTINYLMKKKIFETNFIMSRALFWVVQRK